MLTLAAKWILFSFASLLYIGAFIILLSISCMLDDGDIEPTGFLRFIYLSFRKEDPESKWYHKATYIFFSVLYFPFILISYVLDFVLWISNKRSKAKFIKEMKK